MMFLRLLFYVPSLNADSGIEVAKERRHITFKMGGKQGNATQGGGWSFVFAEKLQIGFAVSNVGFLVKISIHGKYS
jgi:hypothetical protein